MVLVILFIVFITGVYCYKNFYVASIPQNIDIKLDDTVINISFNIYDNSFRNDIYYIIKKDKNIPDINDSEWKLTKDNKITYTLDKHIYYVFLKNEDDKIIKVDGTDKFGSITKLEVNKNKVYLPINGSYSPTLVYEGVGSVDDTIVWTSSNPDAVEVSEGGNIVAKGKGNSTITGTMMNKSINIDVVSTNLITKPPTQYDYKKPYLTCDIYSKEENDLMDAILKDRVNTAGYKTRAGTVAAARFLALEFPYRIYYFSENGRVEQNGVDSEGRYYHVGLYLHSSRFDQVGKRSRGPATWGCNMYSGPAHGYRRNGLDCSGFVSWVMLNGGFDVKDVGAGLSNGLDLTDYGKRTVLTKKVVSDNQIKVGDLLSSGGPGGGHIAIIIGEDDQNYYVAESLWTWPNVGVVVMQYRKSNIQNNFYYVMLMDDYYEKDGNLTKMWY